MVLYSCVKIGNDFMAVIYNVMMTYRLSAGAIKLVAADMPKKADAMKNGIS